MRKILIIGAGQSGLQLGLGLLAQGYQVTLISARTPEEIREGWVLSSQVMFHPALEIERRHGLNLWDDQAPHIRGLRACLSAPPGELALAAFCPLDDPAQSTDQRIKMAAWLELFEERGGILRYQPVTPAELDSLSRTGGYDLTIVAAGRGDLAGLFERDPARSLHRDPQRALALAYVNGLAADPEHPQPHVGLNAVPGIGELFVIPALTVGGPGDILFWEAVPGGPLDLWQDRPDPAEHLRLTLEAARRYTPWVYERCNDVELTDPHAVLSGRFPPTVRRPVAELPSGGLALGLADVVVANDPIAGQGSNTAARCADGYLAAIVDRGAAPFDRAWMEQTFETFWASSGAAATNWSNALLGPLPEHVGAALGAASVNPAVARRFGNGFANPSDYADWLLDPEKTRSYLASVGPTVAAAA